MRASVTRYRIRVEETGTDDPPADLRYVLALYFEDERTEDRLEFDLSEGGAWEMLWEMDGQETAERN